jgi:hypothetical protein
MNNPENTPENDEAEPTIGNDKISAEMNAALHAAKEEEQASKTDETPGEESNEGIAEVHEAIANVLGEDEEPINTAEPQRKTKQLRSKISLSERWQRWRISVNVLNANWLIHANMR